MEVDEKPTEEYSDVGGLDKQIQELVEAIVLPMTHKDRFEALGIKPHKGKIYIRRRRTPFCILLLILYNCIDIRDKYIIRNIFSIVLFCFASL